MSLVSMPTCTLNPRTLVIAALTALFAAPVIAHHGWSWAEVDQVELSGSVSEVRMAPPHPSLMVDTAADGSWRVELGNPRGTARAGFDQDSAKPGDPITVIGNRALDASDKRIKAVRVIVGDTTYDIYPERIQN